MMLRLTAPNGQPVDVDPTDIHRIYPNDGTYHPKAKTVLVTSNGIQAVQESFEHVESLLKV